MVFNLYHQLSNIETTAKYVWGFEWDLKYESDPGKALEH